MPGPGLGEAVARLSESVVRISSGDGPSESGGAGIVWRRDGGTTIVTSAHVVERRRVRVSLPDGTAVPGEVVRRDPYRDLALVRAPQLPLVPAAIGDPGRLRPGAVIFAVGHPLGVRDAVSAGILQAVGPLPRGFGLPAPKRLLSWVQADVRLAPGNSGGPLADVEGRVLGVSTMVVAWLALAVPAPEVDVFVSAAERRGAA